MPSSSSLQSSNFLFQSAPDREAGRCFASFRLGHGHQQFQSAPDREAGRCSVFITVFRPVERFNPRPTVRPGDALDDAEVARAALVSIRARP